MATEKGRGKCNREKESGQVQSQHANKTQRNIVGRNTRRTFGHRVVMCCDILGVVNSSLKWSNLSQQHPTCCKRVAKRTQQIVPNKLRYVALACCDRLAGT